MNQEFKKKERGKITNPPNLQNGKCCGTCCYGTLGYENDSYCEKYKEYMDATQICDDWKE